MRVLTCFADADTTVVVCLGGNKDRYEARSGHDWYADHVPVADLIVDHYRSKGVQVTDTADTPDNDELTPKDWLDSTAQEGRYDEAWTHPDPEFPKLLEQSRQRRRTEHGIVTSLAELRRAAGLNQTELAERWGHRQPHVSKVENDPTNVELATLAGYVRALGGRLTITVVAGGHIYCEDLVGS
jgi:hypothetical protein